MTSNAEFERIAEEAQDPGEAPAPEAPAPEEPVPADGEAEVDLGGEDSTAILIQDPESGAVYIAQELTAEDIADLGIEIAPEGEE